VHPARNEREGSMRMLQYDVLVVGAGPAGSCAARAAAKAGASVALVERRSVVGLPVRCAEYIPAMLVGQADVGKDYIAQTTLGMRSYLHGHRIQDMTAPGHVIHRDKFDQALACAAADAGAHVLLGHCVLEREGGQGGCVVLSTPAGDHVRIKAKVIIGADGPHSRVARWVGLSNTHCLPSIQVRLSLLQKLEHTCIYFDESITAGYAWLFPKGETANVGLGMLRQKHTPGLHRVLRRFVRGLSALGLVRDEPLAFTGGWIPAGPPRPCVAGDILLAGDAAGHTHPITGAGIFQAVIGGQMAGRWAARAVAEGHMAVLQGYADEWNDFYGDVLSHAHKRRLDWEGYNGVLDHSINRFWIGFREYYAAS